MQSRLWLNASIALAVPLCASYSGCTDEESTTTSSSSTSVSSSSSSGGGAGGAGGGVANDSCPGEGIALVAGTPQTLMGSTADATDDYESFCADTTPEADAPDVAYQVTVAAPCTLQVDLDDGAGFDGAFSIREATCVSRAGGDACVNLATDNETYRGHFDAGTFYVVVDGANNTSGDFELTFACAAPACGDGIVNPGEECDVGAGAPDDTCTDPGDPAGECQFEETPPELDTCDGPLFAIALDETLLIPSALPAADTTTATDDYSGSCQPEGGGHDQVYHFQPSASGTLTVTIGNDELGVPYCADQRSLGCWDRALYVRGPLVGDCTSADLAAELDCSDSGDSPDAVEQIQIPVVTGMHYFVIVDGYDGMDYSYGPYFLQASLTLTPP